MAVLSAFQVTAPIEFWTNRTDPSDMAVFTPPVSILGQPFTSVGGFARMRCPGGITDPQDACFNREGSWQLFENGTSPYLVDLPFKVLTVTTLVRSHFHRFNVHLIYCNFQGSPNRGLTYLDHAPIMEGDSGEPKPPSFIVSVPLTGSVLELAHRTAALDFQGLWYVGFCPIPNI